MRRLFLVVIIPVLWVGCTNSDQITSLKEELSEARNNLQVFQKENKEIKEKLDVALAEIKILKTTPSVLFQQAVDIFKRGKESSDYSALEMAEIEINVTVHVV